MRAALVYLAVWMTLVGSLAVISSAHPTRPAHPSGPGSAAAGRSCDGRPAPAARPGPSSAAAAHSRRPEREGVPAPLRLEVRVPRPLWHLLARALDLDDPDGTQPGRSREVPILVLPLG